MHGKIEFMNASELGRFLREFTGSTATFYVVEDPTIKGAYVLTFDGGF
jgi:hypothetical protein